MAKSLIVLFCSLVLYVASYALGSDPVREDVEKTFSSQIGIKEVGHNGGEQVGQYLFSVDAPDGSAWCAAFVSWCLTKNGIPNPRSAWSPAYFHETKVIYQRGAFKKAEPQSGDVFGIWFNDKGRVAHVGFILSWSDREVVTVEGNTNEAGGNDGDGVYKKIRLANQIYQVSDFISGN